MTWHVLPGEHAAFTEAQIPPQALQGIPHQRGEKAVVVKHDYPTWVRMRARGMVIPTPLVHYNWPGRFKPYKHQFKTAEFLISHPKGYCFNGLGTGKTLSAAWAMDYLMQQGVVRRVLIIAPLAVCTNVWEPELFRTLPHVRAQVVEGDSAKKQAIVQREATQVLIVNPESLHIVTQHLGEVDMVIVDEATKFKNPQTKRWKALKNLTTDVPYLWLMTGTPSPQSPMDAYGLLRLIRKKYISMQAWRDMTMYQVSKFRWLPKDDADKTIAEWLQPAVWFKREDCPDMPDMPEPIEIPVALTKQQKDLCQKLTDEARAMIEGDQTISAPNAAAVLSKIMQVQSGGVYAQDPEGERIVYDVPAGPYFDAIEDFVEQADSTVLIVTPFRACARQVTEHLAKAKYRVGHIHGDVKKKDRAEILRDASDGMLDALVAVPGTMSHGVDGLQRSARFILWAAPTHSAEEYDQTIGRIVRGGQKKSVVIAHIIASPLAKTLFARLKSKARLQDAVLKLIGDSQ